MANENRRNEGRGSGRDDLKSREYRGADGQTHHHTKSYMQQHGQSDRSRRDDERGRDGGRESRRDDDRR